MNYIQLKSIKEEFNKQLSKLTKYESNVLCEVPCNELLESAIGESCRYSDNINNNRIQQESQSVYN